MARAGHLAVLMKMAGPGDVAGLGSVY